MRVIVAANQTVFEGHKVYFEGQIIEDFRSEKTDAVIPIDEQGNPIEWGHHKAKNPKPAPDNPVQVTQMDVKAAALAGLRS